MQFEYVQVLDIFCQQLGDMYQLERVCAPFGCSVWEYVYLYLEYVYLYMGNICQLEVEECAFLRIYDNI